MTTVFGRFDLTGKSAVVTGGATGLGYHMARALACAGATVMIGARREAVLRESAERLMADPLIDRVLYHTVDLASPPSIAAFAAHAIEKFGGVDIFVGNAGTVSAEQVDDIRQETMESLLQVNLTCNVQLVQAFIPEMRRRKWGRILFSSSVASHLAVPQEGNIVYSTTKAGLNALTRSLAADLGRLGITVNALILGLFKTDLLLSVEAQIRGEAGDARADEFMAAFVDGTALGRLGEPQDLEGIIQLLASDAGSFVTGATLAVDGGTSIMLRPYRPSGT